MDDYINISYKLYLDFCDENNYVKISKDEYKELLDKAIRKLERMQRPTEGKANLVVYKVHDTIIKYKLVDESIQINFFTEEHYTDIISKYKE